MSKNLRIAVITLGEMGHALPCIHIADELNQRGHIVTYITSNYNGEKIAKMVENLEENSQGKKVEPHATQDDITNIDMLPGEKAKKKDGKTGFQRWTPYIVTKLQDFQPDIAVVDVMTTSGMDACDQLQVPVVVNIPGPTDLFSIFGPPIVRKQSTFSCCGFICVRQLAGEFVMKRIFQKTFNNDGLLKSVGEITQRVCLINSFWGLEKALPLPPNIVMTGPLMKNSSNLLQELERKDSDLFAWMNDAQDKGEMIIYLSLGSMCGWTKWEIEGLFHGIKAIPNCRVIWSIKEKYHELIPDKNDPMFWISSWLPQVELVCHPAVKAALTHCGFGGTLEYINAGIPMLCLPHFGDQGPNAKLLKEAGVCEILIDLKHAQRGHSENIDLGDKPLFDAPKITKLFQKVLTQPEY